MGIEEKKLAKKIRLLNAAYELFGSKGVNMTAVDEVVKLAGVAKGTFYLYFKDKYDLLDQIILAKSEAIFIAAMALAEDDPARGAPEKLRIFTAEILRHLRTDRALVSLLQRNLPAFQALVMSREDARLSGIAEKLVGIFMEATGDRVRAEKLLYIYISTVGSVCCNCILTGDPYQMEEIEPELYTVIRRLFAKE